MDTKMTECPKRNFLEEYRDVTEEALPPSYEEVADSAASPSTSNQPTGRIPPPLHITKYHTSTTRLRYETGEELFVTFKPSGSILDGFLHAGPDKKAPIVLSSRFTRHPLQEHVCFVDHRKTDRPEWIEVEKFATKGICRFKLPRGGRQFAWYLGDPAHHHKGEWLLKEVIDGVSEEDGPRLCTFVRPATSGKGPGTFQWARELSREEELVAIMSLIIMAPRTKSGGLIAGDGLIAVVAAVAYTAMSGLG
ncbi:Hypothetical protein D9617_1g088910 [Elsinoe fawcettii]|nr:Hypothetical protein D9617_1g088910 [Elsinoe fawcettii]